MSSSALRVPPPVPAINLAVIRLSGMWTWRWSLTVQRAVCAQSSVFVHCQRIEPGRGTPAFRQGVRSLVRLRGLELIAIALPGVHRRHRHWHMGAIDQGKAGRQDRGRGSPTPPPGWSLGDGGTVGYERELQQPLAGSWVSPPPAAAAAPRWGLGRSPRGPCCPGAGRDSWAGAACRRAWRAIHPRHFPRGADCEARGPRCRD